MFKILLFSIGLVFASSSFAKTVTLKVDLWCETCPDNDGDCYLWSVQSFQPAVEMELQPNNGHYNTWVGKWTAEYSCPLTHNSSVPILGDLKIIQNDAFGDLRTSLHPVVKVEQGDPSSDINLLPDDIADFNYLGITGPLLKIDSLNVYPNIGINNI